MNHTARPDAQAHRGGDNDAPQPAGGPETKRRAGVIDSFLKSPFAGIAPWALLSILSGPGRFEEAVLAALGFSLLVMLAGLIRGIKVHALEVFGALFFAALAVVGLVATDSMIGWLELWSGELTNICLASFAWFTLLIRKPFTMAYAKDTTPQEYWASQLFRRINAVLTAVWASAFTFAAAVGFIGDYVFHDPSNFWTGWILQLAAIFFAVAVTEFYPDYASARLDLANGEPVRLPSTVGLIEWLPTFVVVTGIAGLVTGSVDFAVGIALIVTGSVASGLVVKLFAASRP
ncbi:hypothetical protein [Mycobacterium attenuatum]|uniref:hypothetical protein n=1 Tax=Mycobacterium attenuatum TaxID=2341086 RepID=UPI000F237701|nr:hypothetical protein LAUMK41_03567 [Mycobacterium attenuatum]